MSIDEKYDNAIQLLHGYYDGKNELLRIASSMLEENGFGIDFYGEFRSMICPRLAREGILRESPFSFLPSDKGIIDQERYKELSRELDMPPFSWDRFEKIAGAMSSLDRIITFVVDGKKLEAEYAKHKTMLSGAAVREAMGKTELQEQPTRREKPPKSIRRLITKHPADGDYYYQDRPISVNTETLYYDVFDILILHAGQDGSLSYEQIEGQLVKRKYPPAENDDKRNKRIQNAISNEKQGFFRNAKVGARVMKNETPDGRQRIVEVVRGLGLKLNNPILK
jgi:hypothetical protein